MTRLPGTLRQWHWISSAICMIALLFFTATGITLNHAELIPATVTTETIERPLPPTLLASVRMVAQHSQATTTPLPAALQQWLATSAELPPTGGTPAEWHPDEIYLALPRPGGDGWLSVDLVSGTVIVEQTTRGWIAYFNDLHKGRNTGMAWRWFIDVFAVACGVFSITGLWLLIRQAQVRPSTWPMVGLGLVIPALVLLIFSH